MCQTGAIGMAEAGFRPPLPRAYKLPGESGIATLHMMTAEDQPQPAPPMAGKPKWPYMKTQLSGAFSASPSRLNAITVRKIAVFLGVAARIEERKVAIVLCQGGDAAAARGRCGVPPDYAAAKSASSMKSSRSSSRATV